MKTHKNGRYFTLFTLLIFIVAGCRIYTKIATSTDVNTDFSKYKTFAWLPDKIDSINQPYNGEIIRNNIRNYVGQSFAQRGYSVNLEKPDLLLQMVLSNQKKEKVVIYSYPGPYYNCRYYYGSIYYFPYLYDYYYNYYDSYCYPPNYSPQSIEYVESSITLNVIDRLQNKMIWSGTAKGNIYNPANVNKNIHPAVKAIMKKYPVKPVQSSDKEN